ncbi:MAG: hypothetical protein GHHEDOFH_01554 [Pseudorhodoplanes sp.]|nr:hypothetical protein [Pseudorhodoplanes sp.]
MTKKEIAGFQPGARPICAFCNAPWTDEMIRVYDVDARHGEGSYDFGPECQRATVDIECKSCGRLIYRKEYRADPYLPAHGAID